MGRYSVRKRSVHCPIIQYPESNAAGNTAGFSTTQKNAISSPAEGLIVYDLTLHKLCVYTGSAWETITSL